MKFLVPNYSCLQNPWLGGYRRQIPVLSVLNWICWTPPQTKFLGTPLVSWLSTMKDFRYPPILLMFHILWDVMQGNGLSVTFQKLEKMNHVIQRHVPDKLNPQPSTNFPKTCIWNLHYWHFKKMPSLSSGVTPDHNLNNMWLLFSLHMKTLRLKVW